MILLRLHRPANNLLNIFEKQLRTVTVSSNKTVTTKSDNNLKSWREIPGPSSLPLLGPLLHCLPGGSLYNLRLQELASKLYKQYGPIVRLDGMLGLKPHLLIFDPDSTEHILRGENKLIPVRPGLNSLDHYRHEVRDKKPGEVTGLMTDNGEAWKELRSITSPLLLHPKIIKLYSKPLDDVALDMVERFRRLRDKNVLNKTFDQEINLWSLESVSVVALGSRIGCLTPNLSDDDPVKRLIRCIRNLFIMCEKIDFKPNIWKYVATPNYKKCMKLYKELDELCIYFINIAKENFKNNPNIDDEKSVLEKLLEKDERIAIIMASDLLSAGVDTTSNLAIGALYLLAKNQDKQNKLREELKTDPNSRSYLKACMKETLRLMPIVIGNSRITTKDYNILGYKIPANLRISFMHQEMSLMEKHFVRAKEFIPERWLVDKTDPLYYRNAHPFAYGPFGFGVRSCVGRRIAELETEYLVMRTIENFHIGWNGPPPQVKQTVVNYIKGPFHFVFDDIQ